jgi:hypothetical protein
MPVNKYHIELTQLGASWSYEIDYRTPPGRWSGLPQKERGFQTADAAFEAARVRLQAISNG